LATSNSNQLTGIAGTYYVAAELSRMGYLAYPTSRNVGEVDILAANPRTGKSVSIQVNIASREQNWRLALDFERESRRAEEQKLILCFLEFTKTIQILHRTKPISS